ncbi:hypothetical protein [Methylobacterium currus]|uniref:hypothetical protein n=1 Tax=Methylobacterium currus TaxID=2051553 RepID=UPI0013E0D612|nr:hypothetical protein [Methylobacterium currus]
MTRRQTGCALAGHMTGPVRAHPADEAANQSGFSATIACDTSIDDFIFHDFASQAI